MRFTPKSEDEIAAENMLPPGTYGFEIAAAEETTSKAGNDMIKLTVHVFSEDGTPTTIFDYLMEKVAYRLRHCAEACDLLAEYESGEVRAHSFVGKTGRCKVAVQKDKSGQFPDKNTIADYLRPVGAATPRSSARAKVGAGVGTDLDDEIPFAACWQ